MIHHTRPALIGGFVVGGIALVIAALVIVAGSKFSHNTAAFVTYFPGSVDGLATGAPVKFRGLEVGFVRDIYLNLSKLPREPRPSRIPVVIELDADRFATRGLTVDLHDRANLDRVIKLGLRARMSSGSLLTGQRALELDLVPDSAVDLVADPSVELPEIPTLPGTFDGVQANAVATLERIAHLDFDRLAATLQHALDGVDRAVNDPAIAATLADVRAAAGELRGTIGELRTTLAEVRGAVPEARAALTAARGALTEGATGATALVGKADRLLDRATAAADGAATLAPVGRDLTASAQRTLATIDGAVRALQHLAEHLDRDPAAVLRGGNP
jgi:paraquat-inducible protein B